MLFQLLLKEKEQSCNMAEEELLRIRRVSLIVEVQAFVQPFLALSSL